MPTRRWSGCLISLGKGWSVIRCPAVPAQGTVSVSTALLHRGEHHVHPHRHLRPGRPPGRRLPATQRPQRTGSPRRPGFSAVWLADDERNRYSGVYHFASKADADRSRTTPLFAGLIGNAAFADLVIEEYDTLAEPTAVTWKETAAVPVA